MSLVLISGLVLVAVIAAISLASAAAIQTRAPARVGAIRPLSEPIAGVLTAGNPSRPTPPAPPVSAEPPLLHRKTTPLSALNIDLTPAECAQYVAASVPRFNFNVLTPLAPIAQEVTAYVRGDDAFDVSYTLRDPAGEYAGEMGATIARSVTRGGFKQAVALEVWLFDRDDLRSPILLLMSDAAYNDPLLRSEELEARGEIVVAEPGAMFRVMAASLQLQVIVVDMTLMPDGRSFETLTLELAVWQHSGSPIEMKMPNGPLRLMAGDPAPAPPSPSPTPAPAVDDPPEREGGIPRATEERIRTSYTIDYTRRTYINQPFVVRVNVPGLHMTREAAAPVPSVTGMPRSPGELAFVHRWYPAFQESAKRYPGLRVELKFREDEFQVPAPRQTALYREGEQITFEFIVKPLRPDVLLLTVEFYYLGARWVEEQDIEVLLTRDARSGDVRTITSRRIPAKLVGDVRLLQAETLSIDVHSFLTLNAPELSAITRIAGGMLTLAYVLWALLAGRVTTVADGLAVAGGSLAAALVMVLAPYLVAWWNGRLLPAPPREDRRG